MNSSLFVAYLITVTVLIVTPGPDMLLCLATGLRGGPRAGFVTALGVATGEVVHIGIAAVGLAALFEAAPLLFDLVRILGACYLLLLGIRTLRSRNQTIGGIKDVAYDQAFRSGVITNLLNPKMALFTIAFLPQFVDPSAGNVTVQFLILGVCFVALEIAVDGSVGVVAGHLTRFIRRRRIRRNVNIASGSIYLALGVRVALER